jgi:hypothetical protein
MRYYLYVSVTKVEMLHSQIGMSHFGKLKTGLKLKLGIAEASIESETANKALFDKAEEVRSKLISQSKTGSLERPKSYIDDVANLSFGHVREYASSIAFFGGFVGNKKVALIGAASSLVGAVPAAEANHAPYYYTMKFMNGALEHNTSIRKLPYVDSLEQAVDIAQAAVITPPEPLAFTALVLHNSPNLLVATPVFVARAEL